MANTTDPNHMTDSNRLDEVAAILATGLRRLRARRRKERAFSPDNCLGGAGETRPPAVNP